MNTASARNRAATPKALRPPGWQQPAVAVTTTSLPPVAVVTDAATGSRIPFLLFCMQTVILVGRPQDYIPALAALRPALLLTFGSLVLAMVMRHDSSGNPLVRRDTRAFLFFLAAMMASIPAGIYPRRSFDYLVGYVVNVVFFFLFVHHVNSVERLKQIIVALVVTALAFAMLGLSQGDFYDGRYATVSTMFDPNDLCFVVISLLAYPLMALLGPFSKSAKALAPVAIVCGLLMALFTGSRGGVLGLATFVGVFLVRRIPSVGKVRKALLIVAMAAMAALNADKINMERYLTIGELGQDYNATDEQGRITVWKRGFHIFTMHPLAGVGVENFAEAIGTVRLQLNQKPRWQTAHNTYVQVLAETGAFGAAAFLGLLIATLRTLIRLARRPQALEAAGLKVVPGVMLVGVVAQLVTAVFLSQAYSVLFCLTFAMAIALRQVAESAAEPLANAAPVASPAARAPQPVRPYGIRVRP
jgi:O-antigen ligase